MGNEYGSSAWLGIFGLTIVDEGKVFSIEDMFTENQWSYMARDIYLMDNLGQPWMPPIVHTLKKTLERTSFDPNSLILDKDFVKMQSDIEAYQQAMRDANAEALERYRLAQETQMRLAAELAAKKIADDLLFLPESNIGTSMIDQSEIVDKDIDIADDLGEEIFSRPDTPGSHGNEYEGAKVTAITTFVYHGYMGVVMSTEVEETSKKNGQYGGYFIRRIMLFNTGGIHEKLCDFYFLDLVKNDIDKQIQEPYFDYLWKIGGYNLGNYVGFQTGYGGSMSNASTYSQVLQDIEDRHSAREYYYDFEFNKLMEIVDPGDLLKQGGAWMHRKRARAAGWIMLDYMFNVDSNGKLTKDIVAENDIKKDSQAQYALYIKKYEEASGRKVNNPSLSNDFRDMLIKDLHVNADEKFEASIYDDTIELMKKIKFDLLFAEIFSPRSYQTGTYLNRNAGAYVDMTYIMPGNGEKFLNNILSFFGAQNKLSEYRRLTQGSVAQGAHGQKIITFNRRIRDITVGNTKDRPNESNWMEADDARLWFYLDYSDAAEKAVAISKSIQSNSNLTGKVITVVSNAISKLAVELNVSYEYRFAGISRGKTNYTKVTLKSYYRKPNSLGTRFVDFMNNLIGASVPMGDEKFVGAQVSLSSPTTMSSYSDNVVGTLLRQTILKSLGYPKVSGWWIFKGENWPQMSDIEAIASPGDYITIYIEPSITGSIDVRDLKLGPADIGKDETCYLNLNNIASVIMKYVY